MRRAIVGTSFFHELETRPTIARLNDALSVEHILAADALMQGLKDVLSTVVQDALQGLIEETGTTRLDAGRWERSEGPKWGGQRFAVEDGLDPGG